MKRRKVGYLICLFCILWINVLYVDYSAFMLLVLFVAVPLISLIYMRIAWLLMRVKLITKNMCIPKEDIRISVKNKSRLAGILNRTVNVDVRMSFLKKKLNYDVKYYKNITEINIIPEHAGYMNVTIKSFVIYDFLMIFKGKRKINRTKSIAVFPELAYASEDKRSEAEYRYYGASDEYEFSYEPEDNTEVIDLRQYRQGDAINHIHWNLSTAGDEYIVRQYGSAIKQENIIIADIICVNNEKERFVLDDIYSALYSAGNVYAENGISASYAVWDDKAQEVLLYSFYDEDSLCEAVCRLMRMEGCNNGAANVIAALKGHDYQTEYKITVITTDGFTGINDIQNEEYAADGLYQDEYNIYNINSMDIKDIPDNMYDFI